jgi:hypothetical protein
MTTSTKMWRPRNAIYRSDPSTSRGLACTAFAVAGMHFVLARRWRVNLSPPFTVLGSDWLCLSRHGRLALCLGLSVCLALSVSLLALS